MSEDGWPPFEADTPLDESLLVYVKIPGTDLTLPFQQGDPAIVLPAFMADLNRCIEPVYNSRGYSDEGTFTRTNSVGTSNHYGATAFDYNWDDHPMGPAPEDPAAGWQGSSLIPGNQVPAVRMLLDWYEGTVQWGGDWTTPKDSMHFQMGYDTYDPATGQAQEWVKDFIRRKIRPDGFSTYVDSGEPGRLPQQPETRAAQVLSDATGITATKAVEILPSVTDGLQAAECTNVNRVAMWLAQIGHESDGFNATEEYASGDENTDRWKYKGRTWIQITWQANYSGFSRWAYSKGLVPTPTYFVDNPRELADLKWAGLGAAWYWTVARPDINALSDNQDVVSVTQRINGGQNGIDGRRRRWNLALSKGDALLTLTTTIGDEDEMAGWTQDLVDRAMVLLENQTGVMRPSTSPFRRPYEGNVNTCGGFAWASDGMIHAGFVEHFAVTYGDPVSIAMLWMVQETAEPGRELDKELAAKVLLKVPDEFIKAAQPIIQSWLDAEAAAKAAG